VKTEKGKGKKGS